MSSGRVRVPAIMSRGIMSRRPILSPESWLRKGTYSPNGTGWRLVYRSSVEPSGSHISPWLSTESGRGPSTTRHRHRNPDRRHGPGNPRVGLRVEERGDGDGVRRPQHEVGLRDGAGFHQSGELDGGWDVVLGHLLRNGD